MSKKETEGFAWAGAELPPIGDREGEIRVYQRRFSALVAVRAIRESPDDRAAFVEGAMDAYREWGLQAAAYRIEIERLTKMAEDALT